MTTEGKLALALLAMAVIALLLDLYLPDKH